MTPTIRADTFDQVKQKTDQLERAGIRYMITLTFDLDTYPPQPVEYRISIKDWNCLDERARTLIHLLT